MTALKKLFRNCYKNKMCKNMIGAQAEWNLFGGENLGWLLLDTLESRREGKKKANKLARFCCYSITQSSIFLVFLCSLFPDLDHLKGLT